MENRKRKRDPETSAPRIKYHVEQLGRSFERILKEDSQEELRGVVRKKLNLDETTHLELVQVREGRLYDLEDDDDFEAFKAAADAYSSLDVRVSFSPRDLPGSGDHTGGSSGPGTSTSRNPSLDQNKGPQGGDKRPTHVVERNVQDESIIHSPKADGIQKVVLPPSDEEDLPAPPKKKRKKDDAAVAVDAPQAGSKAKRKNSKTKDPEPVPADQAQAQEPPKKKQKKKKETETSVSPSENTMPVTLVETVPTVKKPKANKVANKVDADPSTPQQGVSKGKRTQKKKDVQSTITETPDSITFTSVVHDAVPPSPASIIKSTLLALSRRSSRTPEEIMASYNGEDGVDDEDVQTTKQQETAKTTANTKGKGKEKAPTKARVGKSRLSESWVPADNEDAPSTSRAEASSSRESARPPPTEMTGPAVAATISSPAAPVALPSPQRRTGPNVTPKTLSKQASAPSCPVCLTRPFHLRYVCPLIKRGPEAIKERIVELEAEGGWDVLVKELHEWVAKAEKDAIKQLKETDRLSRVGTGSKNILSSAPRTGQRLDSKVSIPDWASVGDGQLSEVTVESRNEGSEGEETSSSDSSPGDNNGNGNHSNTDSESDSGPSSKSELDTVTKSLDVDLEGVDLEALIRGPAVKVQLATLGDEDNSDSERSSLLLEEEEEKPRRVKGWRVERSSSPEGVGDDEDDSEGELKPDGEAHIAAGEVNGSVHDEEADPRPLGDGNITVPARLTSVEAETSHPEVQSTSVHKPSPAPQEEQGTEDVNVALWEPRNALTSDESSPKMSAALPPATPTRPPTSRVSSISRSPLVQQMKDRHGTLPLNPPDDEIGNSLPTPLAINAVSSPEPEQEVEQRTRGRSSAPSRAKPTARVTRSRSRTAPPASSSTASTPTPSESAPKRRGRPPLTEAVKAERKAIKDAEKAVREAARAAEKRAKTEEKNMAKKFLIPSKTGKKNASDPKAVLSVSEVDAPPTSTPLLASQWKTLAHTPSSMSRSSPAIDQLMSSSPPARPDTGPSDVEEIAIPGGADGIKSPGAVSVTTSTSRRLDEDDVEQIVGSPKASEKLKVLPTSRVPLFLPGASQMTQSQPIYYPPHQRAEKLRTVASEKPSKSDSESETEAESGEDERTPKKTIIPRPSQPSKSSIPSLMQLSFQNFKPSFLLPGSVFSQNKEEKQDTQPSDDESDSDDEDSSDEEKHSHIPKGRSAGSGVVRKRKSRGLLVD